MDEKCFISSLSFKELDNYLESVEEEFFQEEQVNKRKKKGEKKDE